MKKGIKILLITISILLALATTVVYILRESKVYEAEWYYWIFGLSYSISIIALVLSSSAHKIQQKGIDDILLNTQNLLSRGQTKVNKNGIESLEYNDSAIIEVILYAMYKANQIHPFSIEKIFPDNIEIVSLLIDAIFSSYKHDVLYGYVNRNNLLVVDCFDIDKIPLHTDGRNFGSNYSKQIRNQLIDAKKRIDDSVK